MAKSINRARNAKRAKRRTSPKSKNHHRITNRRKHTNAAKTAKNHPHHLSDRSKKPYGAKFGPSTTETRISSAAKSPPPDSNCQISGSHTASPLIPPNDSKDSTNQTSSSSSKKLPAFENSSSTQSSVSMTSKNARMLMIGNPTSLAGTFYDSFHKIATNGKLSTSQLSKPRTSKLTSLRTANETPQNSPTTTTRRLISPDLQLQFGPMRSGNNTANDLPHTKSEYSASSPMKPTTL